MQLKSISLCNNVNFFRVLKYYILFGPPGAGKGTQANTIAEKYNLKHISTGELLRNEIASGTELGKMARNIIEAGNLVPDYIVEGMIEHVFHTAKDVAGFLLDGFPRTTQQARDLDTMLMQRSERVNAVISIMISDEVIRKRLMHRAAIEGRADDANEETIKNRIATYHKKTEPLIEYYKQDDKYHEVEGEGGIEEVRDNLFDLFNGIDMLEGIIIDETLLDSLQQQAHRSARLRMNYDLRNTEDEDSQRMLNVLWPGTKLIVHRHQQTNETFLLLRGKVDCVLYNDDGTEMQRIHMGGKTGVMGVNIPQGVYHTVEVHELSITFTGKQGRWTSPAPEDILNIN